MDLILLAFLLLGGKLNPLLAPVLLAAAAHLSVVISERFTVLWAGVVVTLSCLLLVPLWRGAEDTRFYLAAARSLLVSAFGSALPVHRAQRLNARDLEAPLRR